MKFDPNDEVMLEVAKLRKLVSDCCPELLDQQAVTEEDHDMDATVGALSRHRQKIMLEAAGTTSEKPLYHWASMF